MKKLIDTDISPDLIKRYNIPGPRYTSYPTVPVWKEDNFSKEYSDCLKREAKHEKPISLYIHIPFCKQLCTFCGCNKYITNSQNLVEKYLIALESEICTIADNLDKKKDLAEIHLGGGTPTFLSPKQLEKLMGTIFSKFKTNLVKEWAFEADPRVTSKKHLELLYEFGFRRVSFGVQDLNPEIQKAINRNQTSEQSWRTLNDAKKIGYKSINLDLIYGLPLQTKSLFRHTLEEVLKMSPDRLAIYSFAFLPGMFKTHLRAIREKDLPNAEEKINIYLESIKFLEKSGYVMIGMDHYSLPEDELARALNNKTLHRNFMGYTTLHNMTQIGIGVSAISDFGDNYFQNQKNIKKYIDEISDCNIIPRKGIHLDMEDQLRRKIIDTFMCQGEISIKYFENFYKIDFIKHFENAWKKLKVFEEEKLVKLSPKRILITKLGRIFMRNIVMTFDKHLETIKSPKFSKTI